MTELNYMLDWNDPEDIFHSSVKGLIKTAQDNNTIIPIPVKMYKGEGVNLAYIEIVSLMLAQIDCSHCDALCCKKSCSVDNGPIGMLSYEAKNIKDKYGIAISKSSEIRELDYYYINYPCEFLKDCKCTIYNDRPLNCITFPVQNAGEDGDGNKLFSLSSMCPEARKLAEKVYMTHWLTRKSHIKMLKEVRIEIARKHMKR
jgi:Fe-S-cluster containining protein